MNARLFLIVIVAILVTGCTGEPPIATTETPTTTETLFHVVSERGEMDASSVSVYKSPFDLTACQAMVINARLLVTSPCISGERVVVSWPMKVRVNLPDWTYSCGAGTCEIDLTQYYHWQIIECGRAYDAPTKHRCERRFNHAAPNPFAGVTDWMLTVFISTTN